MTNESVAEIQKQTSEYQMYMEHAIKERESGYTQIDNLKKAYNAIVDVVWAGVVKQPIVELKDVVEVKKQLKRTKTNITELEQFVGERNAYVANLAVKIHQNKKVLETAKLQPVSKVVAEQGCKIYQFPYARKDQPSTPKPS
jgi:hypothetical protein